MGFCTGQQKMKFNMGEDLKLRNINEGLLQYINIYDIFMMQVLNLTAQSILTTANINKCS